MRFTVGQPVIIHNEFKGVIIECMSWLHYGHHVYKIQLDNQSDSCYFSEPKLRLVKPDTKAVAALLPPNLREDFTQWIGKES